MSECWGKMLVSRCCGELRGQGADERQRSNSLQHRGRAGGGRCSLLQWEEEKGRVVKCQNLLPFHWGDWRASAGTKRESAV